VITALKDWEAWIIIVIGGIFIGILIGIVVAYPQILLAFATVGVVAAPAVLWITVANGRGCIRFSRDIWLTRRWFRHIGGGVSGDELGRIYHLTRTECGRAALLERVQSRSGVEKDEASAGSVQHLASYIDARLAGNPRHPRRSTGQGPFRRLLYRLAAAIDSTDWSLSGKYLSSQRDSIYMILEGSRRSALTEHAASAYRAYDYEEPGTVATC
jgi:hypothetical protein